MLGPLLGPYAWQAEVRSVLNEVMTHLPADQQAHVQQIPLVFDPSSSSINAFAGCDEKGSPFIAATEGLLEAIDAISQTVANDDLFGTHTYDQYITAVMPRLVGGQGSAALPLGIIPFMTILDFKRISHAHELFDEIAAFTFGHELAHHYLGHTGCAPGFTGPGGAVVHGAAVAVQMGAQYVPVLNQGNESFADAAGCNSTLEAGRARRPNFVWTERGGLLILDFFSHMESAAGGGALNLGGYFRNHPRPAFRIPLVHTTALVWHQTHPG
jgi:hypothetical protein